MLLFHPLSSSPQRLLRRPSRSPSHPLLSLLLLTEKRRMKGTRSWRSFRLDACEHSYTSWQTSGQGLLISAYWGPFAYRFFLWSLILLEVATAGCNGCQNKGSFLSPDNSWYSCGCGALSLYPTLKVSITPISL